MVAARLPADELHDWIARRRRLRIVPRSQPPPPTRDEVNAELLARLLELSQPIPKPKEWRRGADRYTGTRYCVECSSLVRTCGH